MPLVVSLPPAVGAIDFYIDLAIDCVETVNVTVPCEVSVAAWPLPVVVRRNVSSICASAKVGQYFGFYNQAGTRGFAPTHPWLAGCASGRSQLLRAVVHVLGRRQHQRADSHVQGCLQPCHWPDQAWRAALLRRCSVRLAIL